VWLLHGERRLSRQRLLSPDAVVASWQELGEAELSRLGLSLDDVSKVAWWVDEGGLASTDRARPVELAICWLTMLGECAIPLTLVLALPPLSPCSPSPSASTSWSR
jgi:hypothetical protein